MWCECCFSLVFTAEEVGKSSLSQIDKVIYLPVLGWFLVYLVALYAITYSYFIPFILTTMITREELYDVVMLELSTLMAYLGTHTGFSLATLPVCLWPAMAVNLLLSLQS